MGKAQGKKAPMHFKTMVQADVPQGRNGKHQLIVTTILNDLDNLQDGTSEQGAASATGAIQGKVGRKVATASDADYLYVWNQSE